jgi:PTS system mannose-specific IIA component
MARKRRTTVMSRRKQEPPVGVVVLTHDQAAVGMVSAAFAIMGELPGVVPVCAGVGESFPSMIEKISRACDSVDEGAGVLLLVDVHGSSPFNAAMTMLDGTRPAEVLCGVNLPMLIKLGTVDRALTTPVALAEELREAGRRAIRLGSELTGKVAVGENR